ncbi:MAG: ABC transporter ATP-binding protein [Myxococcales bacterium]|nr:ABC transporter ATP-binding protein [Myxococcales bacterium]
MVLESKLRPGEAMIRVEGVTKFYFGEPVLRDINLEVPAGSNLGLIGPGGSGKSLLLKIVAGLVEPDRGRVFVDGHDIQALSITDLAALRFKIGMLFQNYALFDFMNVSENIAFPLRQAGGFEEDAIQKRVKEQLELVGLPGIGHQYANELSGGMKKRVSFCRAVITEPPILFYDDPTAGLDPVTSSKIFIHLRRMQQRGGTTAITITHDIEGLKDICDAFAMMERGRLIFHGSRDAIEDCEIKLVRQFWEGVSDD